MGVLDDAFDSLASEVSVQLSERVGIVIARDMGGTFSASAGTETGGTTVSTAVLACVRENDRVEDIAGHSGGFTRKRVVEYLIVRADLDADAAWSGAGFGLPQENDSITHPASAGGDDVAMRVTRVSEEVSRAMVRIVVMVDV